MFIPPVQETSSDNGASPINNPPIKVKWESHTVQAPTSLPTKEIMVSYQSSQQVLAKDINEFIEKDLEQTFSISSSEDAEQISFLFENSVIHLNYNKEVVEVHSEEDLSKDNPEDLMEATTSSEEEENFFEDEFENPFEARLQTGEERQNVDMQVDSVETEIEIVNIETVIINEEKEIVHEEKEGVHEEKEIFEIEQEVVSSKVKANIDIHVRAFNTILKNLDIEIKDPHFVEKRFTQALANKESLSEEEVHQLHEKIFRKAIKKGLFVDKNGLPISNERAQELVKEFKRVYHEHYHSELRLLLEKAKAEEQDSKSPSQESKPSVLSSLLEQDKSSIQRRHLKQVTSFIAVDMTANVKLEKRTIARLIELARLIEKIREKKLDEERLKSMDLKVEILRREIKATIILKENIKATALKAFILRHYIIKISHTSLAPAA